MFTTEQINLVRGCVHSVTNTNLPWNVQVQELDNGLTVHFDETGAVIHADGLNSLARGFFLLSQAAKENKKSGHIAQQRHFASCGAMVDVSRNAVMKVDAVKRYIDHMACLGMNVLMLYTEDTFEVPEYPALGYLRGGYTMAEIREIDDYAASLGVELVPCIQTLAHLAQFLQVSGVYDGAFHRLSDIFEKDVTLVSISDFDRLKASGGIRGVIDFIPIEQYILALEQLAKRRDDVVKRIFEITGVSDIMRGSSNERETATAVEKKTNFGTLRNQDRQNDMQRFLADLYRIKADMICTCFTPDTLAGFVNVSEGYTENVIQEAVSLLKQDKLRGMLLHVESTGIVNTQEEILRTTQGVQILQDLLKDAMSFVSAQPLLLPIYKQMMMTVIGQMPQARSFESVLDQTFSHIKTDLEKPDMQGTEQMQRHTQLTDHQMRMENQALEQQLFERKLSVRKLQQEYELTKEKNAIEREKNLLKQRELDMKEHETQQ